MPTPGTVIAMVNGLITITTIFVATVVIVIIITTMVIAIKALRAATVSDKRRSRAVRTCARTRLQPAAGACMAAATLGMALR